MTPPERLQQLKALDSLTRQDVFDLTILALRIQGRKSISTVLANPTDEEASILCMYRNKEGLACAVGHHIRDNEYVPVMENKTIYTLFTNNICDSLTRRISYHQDLLSGLQLIHDNSVVIDWETDWEKLAAKEGLNYSCPETRP